MPFQSSLTLFLPQLRTSTVTFLNPFITTVDPSMCTDGFPHICWYCSKCLFYQYFQCLKSINISSKHTKHLCTSFYIPLQIPLSVVKTKVKLGMVQFKAFFFHTKSLFPWASLANPSCFYVFSTSCASSFCQTSSASVGF